MKTSGLASALSWLVLLAGATALAPSSQGQSENEISKEINKSKPSCPRVSVSCPSDFKLGEPVLWVATISGVDPETLTYSWTFVGGSIIEGQGTSTIKVIPSGESTHIGSLKIGGLDPSCASTASCSTTTCRIWPVRRMFDSYGLLPNNEETTRLAKFAGALANEPGAQGYIVSYSRRGDTAGEAKVIADRARTFLLNQLGSDGDRIITVDGGFNDQFRIELWVVPQGAAKPRSAKRVDPAKTHSPAGKETGNPPRP